MGEKLVIGPFSKGLKTNPLSFYIDNDAFPQLINAYPWRGRIKRKRGTSLLGRLTRTQTATGANPDMILNGSGAGSANLISVFSLETNTNIVQGSISFSDGTNTYTDSAGIITGVPSGSGTINYASGAVTISGGAAGGTVTGTFDYNPALPVMGLEPLNITKTQFPGTIAFDTTNAYNISTTSPYPIYDVSFYKNPAISASLPGYTPKASQTSLKWNGQTYQQFWSDNYQGAFWATNGIDVPFIGTTIGMQFKPIITVTVTSATTATLQITGHNLVVGDFVFVNEVVTTTGINFQTGYVTSVTNANNVVVKFPNATIAGNGTGGIAQYLTSNADSTKDCLRWYDGDPTVNSGVNGWVNFMPPLFSGNTSFVIDDAPPAQYYLVNARMILNYKDRLLFFGPVIQSSTSLPIYLQDTVIWSQNGTPYYTCSFTGSPTSATTTFNPILVPTNQTATANAYFEDVPGYGGYLSAGYAAPITAVAPNEDTLIVSFSSRQTRFIYTGNDFLPFNFYIVNSELGTSSTFSTVTMDRGIYSIGSHGIIVSNQISSQRIDLDIPDQVFQFNLTNNGPERICAQRDFVNEWIYFTYLDDSVPYNFPNQTLLYNYRDQTWGIFNESYTTYGQFQRSSGYTWATIGSTFPTWASWNEPWSSGSSTLLQPEVIAGNAQGFVLFRDDGTNEATSLAIQSFSGSVVNSPNYCMNDGDYIVISGCLGTIGSIVNGNIYQISRVDNDNFTLIPNIGTGTYLGGGVIQRMYIPFIQSKAFQPAWGLGRKTRLGPQQYLLTTTNNGQVTLYIFLSENLYDVYNSGPIVPAIDPENDALIYSTILYTCPESTNLGLTPANVNLQMVTATSPSQQQQIWHRMNTSLIGDTVQMAITLSPTQMTDTTFSNQFAEIEFHGCIIDLNPSQMLS